MIASDIMTENPRTIRSTATISEAIDVLQSMHVRHLPVVDEADNLIGMISDRDLGLLMTDFVEGVASERTLPLQPASRVTDLMSGNPICVDLDDEVSTIVELLLENRIGAVPVVDGEGAIAGIISYVDLLRALALPGEPTDDRSKRRGPTAWKGSSRAR